MKAARILLFDCNDPADWGDAIHADLLALADPPVVLHQGRFNPTDQAKAPEQLAALLSKTAPDLVILQLSSDRQSLSPQLFRVLLARRHPPPVMVVCGSEDPSVIGELYQLGASDYLVPPFRAIDVRPRLERLLACHRHQDTPVSTIKESLGLQQFKGESPALLEQIRKIPLAARSQVCVLLSGETGTGKEICARAIHHLSGRCDHPFVPVNCGAIPAELVENELFGHEAGAFTSANASHAGMIREADGGTLFLDEIDSLPVSAQVKLLRFLQDKEFRPLGARKACKADVRVIAASNADLAELLRTGKMRQDLFYRLNVFPLRLPPLRERKEDIPVLARHFLEHCTEDERARQFSAAALRKLSLHHWPGNVRELENVVARAAALSQSRIIEAGDIDVPIPEESGSPGEQGFRQLKAKIVADFERSYIATMLERHQGNIARAARAAQKPRRAFFELMRKHRIRVQATAGSAAGMVKLVIEVDQPIQPRGTVA